MTVMGFEHRPTRTRIKLARVRERALPLHENVIFRGVLWFPQLSQLIQYHLLSAALDLSDYVL